MHYQPCGEALVERPFLYDGRFSASCGQSKSNDGFSRENRMRFSEVISAHPNMMSARGLQVVKVAGGDGGKVGPGRYSKHLALRVRSWTKYGRSYRSVSADIFTII